MQSDVEHDPRLAAGMDEPEGIRAIREGSGIDAIAMERCRQIESKGYCAVHDDEHTNGEIAHAAAWYALSDATIAQLIGVGVSIWPRDWTIPELPSGPTLFSRKRELEKAGALIAAEWDRLDRLERQGQPL